MSGSYFALNSKINSLQAQINAITPSPPLPPTANIMTTNTAQTVTAIKTFSVLPQSSVVPTLGDQLVNKTYADATADNTTLQQVLNSGNTATGVTATIDLTNSGVGYTSNPQLTLNNSNATVGNTNGVPSIELTKTGRNGAVNDVIGSVFFNAKDSAGVERTFGKIESTITTTTAPSNHDGALDFYSLINSVNNLVFRMNGSDNENNSFRPLDLNGNTLKTSQLNLTLDATGSSGTGQIIIAPKTTSNVNINGDLVMTTDKTITLTDNAPNVTSTTIGNGALVINDITTSDIATLLPSVLSFGTSAPSTTYYTPAGFYNSDNSIYCNTTNGFFLNYGSAVNFTQLDLTEFEMYNTSVNLIDQITFGNNGVGNPTFNILSTDNTTGIPTPILRQGGISNQSIAFSYTDVLAGTSTQLALQNFTGTGGTGVLQYTNLTDSQPLLIQSNQTGLQLQTATDLILGGASIQSASSSGSSGQYLRILLNGVYYKIALDLD